MILLALFWLLATTSGCAPPSAISTHGDPLQKHQDWERSHTVSGGEWFVDPSDLSELVFESDFRSSPGAGLSRVHRRKNPDVRYYLDFTSVAQLRSSAAQSPVFHDGLAAVHLYGGLWGYIDASGRYIIKTRLPHGACL